MTITKWCVLFACLLPALTASIPKAFSLLLPLNRGKYDNNNPRDWEASLAGWKQRAIAAHLNGFEALPLFIAAVVFAQISNTDPARVDLLAMAFVALRVAYVAMYLLNLGILRTLIWMAAVACNIALFVA